MSVIKPALLSLFLMCHLTLWGCSREAPQAEDIPYVMVSQPLTSHHEQKSYAGEVQARLQSALAFRVAGQVTARLAEVGDRVRAGQVLARLDVSDARLQSQAARAQLESAQAALKTARDELQRFKQLLPMNAVSRSQYDAVENQYKSAESAYRQAEANAQVSANQTRYNQLVASRSGVITERHIEVGQVVAAGQVAYQLAIDGDREVVIGIPEQAIGRIKPGQAAWVVLWSRPQEKLQAQVREISPAADQSRTFKVKLALHKGQTDIQLGQSARVFFDNQQSNVLSVPLSSVSAQEQQAFVWVLTPQQRVRKVAVQLGAYGRDSVPVLSGLQSGDWIVVGGVHLLRDQQQIHAVDRNNRPVQLQAGAQP